MQGSFSRILQGLRTQAGVLTESGGGTPAEGGPVYTDCSNIGTAAFYWNGDKTGSNVTGCKGSSTEIVGELWNSATITVSGTEPLTVSPDSGGNVLHLDATDEQLVFAVTTKDIFDSAEGLITMDVYLAASTGWNYIFQAHNVANLVELAIGSDGTISFSFNGSSSSWGTTTDTIADTTWTNIQFRWKVATAAAIGCKIGAGDWKLKDGGTVTAWSAEPTYVRIGGDGAQTDGVYIDNVFIYKTSGL